MMKKILTFLLSGTLMLTCFSGCAKQTEEGNADANENIETGSADYASSIFDTSYVHQINVEISEEDWADLLANPTEKTKYEVNVTVDGEDYESVSFATKGNTTLSQVAMSDSDRYSFKINFGKYVDDQTYHGLDKLNLNNAMSDATYMKDYLSYAIMREAGVDAPLASYAELSINGEVYGLYVAVEEVGDSFIERNDGSKDTALYKPETESLAAMGGFGNNEGGFGNREDMNGQGGEVPEGATSGGTTFPEGTELPDGGEVPEGTELAEGADASGGMQKPEGMEQPENMELPEGMEKPEDMELPEGMTAPENMELPEGTDAPENMELPEGADAPGNMGPQAGGNGGMQTFDSGDNEGTDLKYIDDEVSSYAAIFDNAETDVTEEDQQELIAALKALSEGTDLENSWDMDAVIRYFVAHNFVVNYDSYTGTMLHNYYLYEEDGKVSILPWDYNLAFGGFNMSGDATSVVNWAIDTPLSGTTEEARPLWNAVVSNEEYLELYHQYFDELIENYFESGECAAEIARISEMIRPYVESDPTAFYTVDEFDAAVETLKSFCELRAESIRGQLDGTIPATTEAQQADTSTLIDAGSLDISTMGTQGGSGKQMGNRQGGMGGNGAGQKPMGNGNSGQSSESTEQDAGN